MTRSAQRIFDKLQSYLLMNTGVSFMEAMEHFKLDECNKYDSDQDVLGIMNIVEDNLKELEDETSD